MKENLKIKPLSKSQIIISLDRLTRFKYTEDKYLRVFKDIITSNLVSPKFKKSQLDLIEYEVLTQLVEEIFNFSLKVLNIEPSNDFKINSKLLKYEKSVFKLDMNVQKLLKNKIDYQSAIKLIDYETLPLNLKWLKSLSTGDEQIKNRQNHGLKFPIEKVVIVEGLTEEILLPKFASMSGFDFDKAGINIISAGGKNQVVKLFYQLVETLKLPIFVLLDNDAKENFHEISLKLRPDDKVYVLEGGEFEDILPLNLLKRTLNKHFRNYSSVLLEDLRKNMPMTKLLGEIFKERGMEFKKAEFASLVYETVSKPQDLSQEIMKVIAQLN